MNLGSVQAYIKDLNFKKSKDGIKDLWLNGLPPTSQPRTLRWELYALPGYGHQGARSLLLLLACPG